MINNNVLDLFDMDKYSEDDIISSLNTMPDIQQLEFLKILEKMYYISKTHFVHKLLYRLFTDNTLEIPPILRIQIIYLFDKNDIDEKIMHQLYHIIEDPDAKLEPVNQFDILIYVFKEFGEYTTMFMTLLKKILCDIRLDEDFRYRSMLESRSYLPSKTEFTEILNTCFYDPSFTIRNKILLCQYTMNHPHHYDEHTISTSTIIDYLVDILLDTQMNNELRMDVADILLNMNNISDELRNQAILIIDEIGTQHNKFSFYHNQENVHYVDISSIQNTLDYLNHKFAYSSKSNIQSNIQFYSNKVKTFDEYQQLEKPDQTKVNVSLIRIQNDRSVYGSYNNTLNDVLGMIYTYIVTHKHTKELQKRLMEELIEMSGKCATGYVIRLINVLSGFDDNITITIPPSESLKSVLFHKLNQKIFEMEDEDMKNDVLYELTLPSSFIHLRPNFLKFFREVFPNLKEELYEQFKDLMSDTDYDLYLRQIVINYEGYQ